MSAYVAKTGLVCRYPNYTAGDTGAAITGTSEEDVITGGAGADTIDGGEGDDTIDGGGSPEPAAVVLQNFDGNGTVAVDETGNGHDGVFQGDAVRGGTGWNGQGTGVLLDGSEDYVEIPNDAAFDLAAGTISVRFNADTLSGEQTIFSRDSMDYDGGGHITTTLRSDGSIEVRLQSDSGNTYLVSSAGTVTAGEWSHVAVSFGPDGASLFLDGIEVDTDAYTGGITGNSEPWTLGADQGVSGDGVADNLRDYFDGSIDEFAVFDRQLTVSEVAEIEASGVALSGDNLSGGDGNDQVTGGNGRDTITGGAGDDRLYGDAGDDTLTISSGADRLEGGDGADTFQVSSATGAFGSDTVVGGEGGVDDDTLDLSGLTAPLTVGFGGNETGTASTDGGANSVNFSQIENLILTNGADYVDAWGDSQGINLEAGAGNDSVFGSYGDDFILGGDGDDYLQGRDGADTIRGGAGNDFFELSSNDSLDGGSGNDTLRSTYQNFAETVTFTSATVGTYDNGTTFENFETFESGNGADSFDASLATGNLTISTGADNDTIIGGSGDDTINGGTGNDQLSGGDGSDTFVFDDTWGTDTITLTGGGADAIDMTSVTADVSVTMDGGQSGIASDGANSVSFEGVYNISLGSGSDTYSGRSEEEWVTLSTGSGDDSVTSGAGGGDFMLGDGNDTLDAYDGTVNVDGGAGNDYIWTHYGDDTIAGGSGDDTIRAEAGDDRVDGGEGADFVSGGYGNDTIRGGAGDDTLQGEQGDDHIDGGEGTDRANFSGDISGFDISYDESTQTFTIVDLNSSDGDSGTDTVTGVETFRFGSTDYSGTELKTIAQQAKDFDTGYAEAATYDGSSSVDNHWAGANDDVIYGRGGDDGLGGGDGNDTIYAGSGNDYAYGQTGNDVVFGGSGNDVLQGDQGFDEIDGGTGNDSLSGGDDNDTLYGGTGDDTMYGDDGADSLYGDIGADYLDGGAGSDTIDGGDGTDLQGNRLKGFYHEI